MLLLSVSTGLAGLDRSAALSLIEELTSSFSSLPGVTRAAYATRALLSPTGGGASVKALFPSRNIADQESGIAIKHNSVSADYFQTIGTRILRGRAFQPNDRQGSSPVAIISQTMAGNFWGDADPIGDIVQVDDTGWEVVGVAEDVKINRIHEPPEPYLYFPFAQRPRSETTFLIETNVEPASLADAIRRTLRDRAPDLAVLQLTTQDELMRYALYYEHTYARLASTLGVLGLFLAATGLFGVISHLVRRRTNEIGVRLALGAQPGQVVMSFVRTGLALGAGGVVLGSCASLVLAGLLSEFLRGVGPRDPLSFIGAAVVVVATIAGASFVPARAAARIDPVRALRHE